MYCECILRDVNNLCSYHIKYIHNAANTTVELPFKKNICIIPYLIKVTPFTAILALWGYTDRPTEKRTD